MRKLISILNPVYWTTAQEVGEAVNGYTLTGGIFRRETQVEFATGKKGKSLIVIQLFICIHKVSSTWCLEAVLHSKILT